VYYRRRNEALALGREFNDPIPTFEEGRMLMDGSSLTEEGKKAISDDMFDVE
jgi:hypothetical protein